MKTGGTATGIWDRVKFIGRSYLNAYLDEEHKGRRSTPAVDVGAEDPSLDEPFDDEAFEREWEAFKRRNAGTTGGSSSGRAHASSAEPTIEECYKRLECAPGSDLKSVRTSFRRLMKLYHPDRAGPEPAKQAEATRICQLITEAYERLEKALETKSGRSAA